MRWISAFFIAFAAMMALPQAAQAAQLDQRATAPVFTTAPVDDAILANLRGGESPFARLTVGTATRIVDDQARADLRQTGSVSRVEMDVWWGSIGSEMIAQNVRAAGGQ